MDKKALIHLLSEQCAKPEAELLAQYLALLQQWNHVYNLTAIDDMREAVIKHIFDSLSIRTYLQGTSIIDVGTGAGLPGIPLAVVCPDKHFTLLDSNGKKTRFLTQTIYDMGLKNVTVCQARAEQYRGQFDCVLSRAFSELSEFVRQAKHLVKQGGIMLAMKGDALLAEIASITEQVHRAECIVLNVPHLNAARTLIKIEV